MPEENIEVGVRITIPGIGRVTITVEEARLLRRQLSELMGQRPRKKTEGKK